MTTDVVTQVTPLGAALRRLCATKLAVIAERLVKYVMCCVLLERICYHRDWELDEEVYEAQKAALRQKVDAGISQELDWITGKGAEPDWPEFPDSVAALRYLKQHYKLVILSNVDRISFRSSNTRLRVRFDAIYTAQDVGAYKPSPRNFEFMLERLAADFGVGPKDTSTPEKIFSPDTSADSASSSVAR